MSYADIFYNALWLLGKSVLVIILGFCAVKLSERPIKKIMTSWKNHLPAKHIDTVQSILLSAIKYAVHFWVFFTVLGFFGVSDAVLMAVAGSLSVAVGLAAQGFVKDIIMGITILMTGSFSVGDILKIGDCVGKVEALGIQATKIRSVNGDLHVIPNSEIKVITKIRVDAENAETYQFPYFNEQTENGGNLE
ncbi:MAG: mechanosensitive ion channel family protein [Clostridiales bacterium]|nr:mechanosensitive ion channel family protein [Clostridiales bacterium]